MSLRRHSISWMTAPTCAVIAVLASIPARAASAPKRPVTTTMVNQQGCPVVITYAKSTLDYLYQQVGLFNPTSSTVTSVTFGVVLSVPANSKATPIYVPTLTVPTNIGPGGTHDVSAYAMRWADLTSKMAQTAGPSIVAQIGVTQVTFADAPTYNYDFQSEGGFQQSVSRLKLPGLPK